MWWLTDRKFICLTSLTFILLLCFGYVRAESSVPGACGSNGLSERAERPDITEHYRPAATPMVGTIEKMVGGAVVLRDDGQSGFTARQGDAVHLGDALFTGEGSTLRLKFENMDVAIMGACANLQIDHYRDDRSNHQKTTRLKSSRGNLLFYVLRLFGYRDIKFEVQTPSRVASVRGTKFGVSVLGTQGNHVNWLMANTSMEKKGTTDCFCDDGSVTIDRSIVHAGIIYRGKARTIDLLTVNDTQQFQSTFKHPLVPKVMNAITPPGHAYGRGHHDKARGPKKNAMDNPSVNRTKEKKARKIKDKGGKGKKK